MSAPGTSGEPKGPSALPENGQNTSSDALYGMNDRFFFSTFRVNLMQRISISQKSDY
jgi:hypothetical protein